MTEANFCQVEYWTLKDGLHDSDASALLLYLADFGPGHSLPSPLRCIWQFSSERSDAKERQGREERICGSLSGSKPPVPFENQQGLPV